MGTSNDQSYIPTIVPQEASPSMRAFLDSELWRIYTHMLRLENQVRQLIRVAELNGIVLIYQWLDGTTTGVNPGAGNVRGNNNQVPNVTQFAFSAFDSYGRNVVGGDLVKSGDIITFANVDLTDSEVFRLTTDPVPQSGWFQFNVTRIAGTNGFNPSTGEYMRVSWRPNDIIETRDI